MLQKLAQTNRLCYKRKTQNKSILLKKIYTETIGTVGNRAYQGRGVPTRGGGCLPGEGGAYQGRGIFGTVGNRAYRGGGACQGRGVFGTVKNRAYQGRGVPTSFWRQKNRDSRRRSGVPILLFRLVQSFIPEQPWCLLYLPDDFSSPQRVVSLPAAPT